MVPEEAATAYTKRVKAAVADRDMEIKFVFPGLPSLCMWALGTEACQQVRLKSWLLLFELNHIHTGITAGGDRRGSHTQQVAGFILKIRNLGTLLNWGIRWSAKPC